MNGVSTRLREQSKKLAELLNKNMDVITECATMNEAADEIDRLVFAFNNLLKIKNGEGGTDMIGKDGFPLKDHT